MKISLSENLRGKGTKLLVGILVGLWIFGLVEPRLAPLFALVPGNTLSIYAHFWTPLTAGFFETSLVMGLANISFVVMVSHLLESQWGERNLMRFVCLVNLCVFLTFFAQMIISYAMTQDDHYLWAPLCGFTGANAGFAVGLMQRYPDDSVISVPVLKYLKFRHLPALITTIGITLYSMGHIADKEVPLLLYGNFYGWLYLRFYMVDEDNHQVGDLRDEFSFSMLFPDIFKLRSLVNVLTSVVWAFFHGLGFFQEVVRTQRSAPLSGGGNFSRSVVGNGRDKAPFDFDYNTGPGPVDANAERRRALAIKAINEKLEALSKRETQSDHGKDSKPASSITGQVGLEEQDRTAEAPVLEPLPAGGL
eukprot:gb/GEZN01008189.1/.p1 GENE.gb/GEZN01008189.1/~~gb/GEZN01008189.1/.p1  ORF type:complete len:363 (-),score=55.03 gb/GEZN01008189.1/:299-1387(-)